MRKWITAASIAVIAGALQAGNWAGPYAGAQVGHLSEVGPGGGNASQYGVHGGFDIDYGNLILGGELEMGRTGLDLGNGAVQLTNVRRIKFRAGHDLGSTVAYAIFGGIHAKSSTSTNAGGDSGAIYGLGVLTAIGEHLTLSGEALRQVFENFSNTGSDLKTDSFSIRVSFRF